MSRRRFDPERKCTCDTCKEVPDYVPKQSRHLKPGMKVTTTRWAEATPLYTTADGTFIKDSNVTNSPMLLIGFARNRAYVQVLGTTIWGWVHRSRIKADKR